jgi:hypothetical protein
MRKAMGSTCAKLWNGYFGENSITALWHMFVITDDILTSHP